MGMILNRALGVIFAMMVTLARQGQHGSVVELAYTSDLRSEAERIEGSSPFTLRQMLDDVRRL